MNELENVLKYLEYKNTQKKNTQKYIRVYSGTYIFNGYSRAQRFALRTNIVKIYLEIHNVISGLLLPPSIYKIKSLVSSGAGKPIDL